MFTELIILLYFELITNSWHTIHYVAIYIFSHVIYELQRMVLLVQ